MAENDQNAPKQETTELEALAAENKEIKNDVTRGQKYVMWGMIAVSVIAVLTVIYIFAIRNPAVKAANEAVAQADMTMTQGNDSLALAQYQQVAKEYGYDAGNNASLMAATLLYKKGEYQQAIDQLKNYVNLKNYDQAVKCYDNAISVSDDNAYYTPLFMIKKATVLREQGKYADELKVLENIRENYSEYCNAYRFDVDKYIGRAKYQAENAK